jgi:molybdopterin-containing oxidoreductase family membrane subunit
MWPNFRSPLVWDVFAVTTYATVSLMFWYVGLIPDLATLRDRTRNLIGRKIYGLFAMGWRGSARHWHNYETAYLLLAGLATPLVVSVHTVVSFDFAAGVIPGWHATIFPPYFVAGAIFAGFAMVLTLALPLRWAFGLEDFITQRHVQNMAKVMLATGLIVGYGYLVEIFMAWYSGNWYEQFMILNRIQGPYKYHWYALILCNLVVPQVVWLKKVRNSPLAIWIIAMFVNVGMWLERFVIVVTSLANDFVPTSWAHYTPTMWDYLLYAGTFGLFTTAFLLFLRFVPMISIFEVKTLLPQAKIKAEH